MPDPYACGCGEGRLYPSYWGGDETMPVLACTARCGDIAEPDPDHPDASPEWMAGYVNSVLVVAGLAPPSPHHGGLTANVHDGTVEVIESLPMNGHHYPAPEIAGWFTRAADVLAAHGLTLQEADGDYTVVGKPGSGDPEEDAGESDTIDETPEENMARLEATLGFRPLPAGGPS